MISKLRNFFLGGETRKHLIKTFVIYGFISLAIIVLKILIARLYGQEELGVFTYFFSVVGLVYLFTSFGFPEALTQIIVKQPQKEKSAIKLYIFYSIFSTTFFLFLTYFFLQMKALDPGFSGFFLAVVFYVLSYSFHYLTYSILRGRKYFVSASVYSLLNRIFLIIFIIALALWAFDFAAFLFAMSLALLLVAIASLPQVFQNFSSEQTPLDHNEYLRLAFSLFLVQVSFYSLRFVDALTITYLVDFVQLGLYSANSSLTNVIRLLGYVFPMVVVPMAAVHNFKLRESLKRILLLLIPFVLLVLLGTYILVPLLYGQEYKAFYLPMALVLSSTLLILYSYFNSIFVGENKFGKFYLRILGIDVLLSLLLNTFLNFLFISWWGIVGAPLATGLTLLFKIALNIYAIKKLRKRKILSF